MRNRSKFHLTMCVAVLCLGATNGTASPLYNLRAKTHGAYSQTKDDRSTETLNNKVQRLSHEGKLPDGIHFLSKDGRLINKRDVESFDGWGKDLRSVAAVVVKLPVGEAGGTIGVDGLKEMLKIDAYKKNFLGNSEGKWHLGEWSNNDAVGLYVIEQRRFSKTKVWKADNLEAIIGNRHFMQMPDNKPLVFRDLAHDAIPPFDKKVIPARDLNRVRNELWEDAAFAAKCKAAHDAAKNIQGDIAMKAPAVQSEPSLFPELNHLKEPPLFPELEHLKHKNVPETAIAQHVPQPPIKTAYTETARRKGENTFEYLVSGRIVGAKYSSKELDFKNKQFLWGDERGKQNFEYDLDIPEFGLSHVTVNLSSNSHRAQLFSLIFEDRNMLLNEANNKSMEQFIREFAKCKEELERRFGVIFRSVEGSIKSRNTLAGTMKAKTRYCNITISSSIVNHKDHFNGGMYAHVLFEVTFDCKQWVLAHKSGTCSISEAIREEQKQ